MEHDLGLEQVKAALTGSFGRYVRYFDEIASTNTEALDWAMCGAPDGSLVVADHQTGGRGRWGRAWFSAPGKLLQISLILRPQLSPDRHGVLTAGLGVACARGVERMTGLPARVKWPNDVVVNERKVAGMLVESTIAGSEIAVAVCGIGINVHLDPSDIPDELKGKASSLAIELDGRGPHRTQLLAAIVDEIEARYDAVRDPKDSSIVQEATELSTVLGQDVVVRHADGTSLEGKAVSLQRDATLVLETAAGPQTIQVGEIEQLRAV